MEYNELLLICAESKEQLSCTITCTVQIPILNCSIYSDRTHYCTACEKAGSVQLLITYVSTNILSKNIAISPNPNLKKKKLTY